MWAHHTTPYRQPLPLKRSSRQSRFRYRSYTSSSHFAPRTVVQALMHIHVTFVAEQARARRAAQDHRHRSALGSGRRRRSGVPLPPAPFLSQAGRINGPRQIPQTPKAAQQLPPPCCRPRPHAPLPVPCCPRRGRGCSPAVALQGLLRAVSSSAGGRRCGAAASDNACEQRLRRELLKGSDGEQVVVRTASKKGMMSA